MDVKAVMEKAKANNNALRLLLQSPLQGHLLARVPQLLLLLRDQVPLHPTAAEVDTLEAIQEDHDPNDPPLDQEPDPDDEQEQDDEEELIPDEDPQEDEIDLHELSQVLTVTARRLVGLTLGRKYSLGVLRLPPQLRSQSESRVRIVLPVVNVGIGRTMTFVP